MAAHMERVKGWNRFVIFLVVGNVIQNCHGLNLGLIAGDLKRQSSPLIIKKYSHHSPVFINVNPKSPFTSSLPSFTLPKLPTKPPPLKLSDPFSKLKSPKLPLLAAPLLPHMPLIPKIPLLPLPLLPPLLPPLIPPLPLVPIPLVPHISLIPKLTSPLNPLKVSILGKKTPLQKALGSEIQPITLPSPEMKRKENILEKLLELRNRGSLTQAEFLRFKRLLLR